MSTLLMIANAAGMLQSVQQDLVKLCALMELRNQEALVHYLRFFFPFFFFFSHHSVILQCIYYSTVLIWKLLQLVSLRGSQAPCGLSHQYHCGVTLQSVNRLHHRAKDTHTHAGSVNSKNVNKASQCCISRDFIFILHKLKIHLTLKYLLQLEKMLWYLGYYEIMTH